MSADSFIPLAIAGAFFFAAPIVIAGLAVAGAAAAVSVVAQTAADASRKAAAEQASRQREQQAGKCDLVCFLRVMVSVCHRLSPFAASFILRRRRSARTAPALPLPFPRQQTAPPDGSADH